MSKKIAEEFLDNPAKRLQNAFLKKVSVMEEQESQLSRSDQGDSMMDDLAEGAEDMNINFDEFKSALKAESKIDKIEAFMNMEECLIDRDKKIRRYLSQSDNLEIFISLISKPHEVESRVWWNELSRIDMKDRLIYENYREYNLRRTNNYYYYDARKLHKMEYINKNPEIKNIFRAFNTLKICLTGKNL